MAGYNAEFPRIRPPMPDYRVPGAFSPTSCQPSELFPTSLRGSASGLAEASGKLGAAGGIFLLPVLSEAWGLAPVMIAVAAISVLGFLITAVFGAGLETSGRALESGGERQEVMVATGAVLSTS
jgi:nitrate/nitrite transporter NarK